MTHATIVILLAAGLFLGMLLFLEIGRQTHLATQMHPPAIIFMKLFGLVLAASLLAGHGMTGSTVRIWFHMLGFALVNWQRFCFISAIVSKRYSQVIEEFCDAGVEFAAFAFTAVTASI
jgi:hypothetical protein